MAEIRVPTLGESVTEATIGKWFKKPGDPVAVDEPLVELETDKVTIEVPAPAAGTLGDIAAKDGETVAVGALLGRSRKVRARPRSLPLPKTGRGESRSKAGRRAGSGSSAESRRRGCAARALGAQDRGRDRHGPRQGRRDRQGRPRHQGRHDGGDRARRGGADTGAAAGRRRAGARALARRRRGARGAREDDAAAPDHRAPAEGRAEHRRDAHDLQRGRHERDHGACAPSTRTCSRSGTA